MTVNKGLRRLIPDRVVLAGHMPDTIPRCRTAFRSNTHNRPASDRNAVRHGPERAISAVTGA
jgi:hypothetical protein